MIDTMKVGPQLTPRLATMYSKRFTRNLGLPTTVVAGGMENLFSPYMLLRVDERLYFLIERRNDDGEWAPLLFDAPAGLDVTDPGAVWHAAASVPEHAQELTWFDLESRGFDVARMVESDCMDDLFIFRDQLSHANGTAS